MADPDRADPDRTEPGVRGVRIARLRGVPVYLGSSWPIIAVVIVALFGPQLHRLRPELGATAYLVAGGYAVLLLVSVLVHEAAHAIAGQAVGYRVNRIVADVWGGHTAYDHADTSPGRSAFVAIVGPMANAVLAVGSWALLPVMPGDIPYLLCAALAWSNTFVAAFNLLPALPLDGGFLVSALVWKVTGDRERGTVIAAWCGRVLAVLLVLVVLVRPALQGTRASLITVVWGILIGGFLWAGATAALRGATARGLLARVRIDEVGEPVTIVAADTTIADLLRLPSTWVAVADDRRIWGLVDPAALAQVPAEHRGSATAGSVARTQPDGWVVEEADPSADASAPVAAVQATHADAVLVLTPQRAFLVRTSVLAQALDRAHQGRQRPGARRP